MTVWFITGARDVGSAGRSHARRCGAGTRWSPTGRNVEAIFSAFLDASSLARAQQTIDDYSGTVGATRMWADDSNQAQPGDPAKAAVAIVDLAAVADPPLRLQLGADCVARIERKLAFLANELEAWREVALSTAVGEEAVEQNALFHQPGRGRT